jgi:hypothetical protein
MTQQVIQPDREELRALYDQAITVLNADRDGLLTTPYYAKVGDTVFETGCKALEDSINNKRQMHTIPAPAGAGKTSFAYAFVAAMTWYSKKHPDAPYGAAFVVEQILSADNTFKELNKLLPGDVHIWTSEHDLNCAEPQKVPTPAARSDVEWLCKYPVIVVTHEFYVGTRGHKARNVNRNGQPPLLSRALTFIDERPKKEATTIDITLGQAQTIRHALTDARPELKEHLDALLHLMEKFSYEAPNKMFRPGIEIDQNALSNSLDWFNSGEANRVVKSEARLGGVDALFAFARALTKGMACIHTSGKLPYFNCWFRRLIVDLTAGSILLDATSDIDGVNIVAPQRCPVEIPPASYANLEIIHIPQHTKKRLRDYFRSKPNLRAYQNGCLRLFRITWSRERQVWWSANRHCLISSSFLIGMKMTKDGRTLGTTPKSWNGYLIMVASSMRPIGALVSAATLGKRPRWCFSLTSSLHRDALLLVTHRPIESKRCSVPILQRSI